MGFEDLEEEEEQREWGGEGDLRIDQGESFFLALLLATTGGEGRRAKGALVFAELGNSESTLRGGRADS